MISKFDVAKALRDQAKIVTDANSLVLVGNGEGFEPDVEKSHIEEIVLYGNDFSVGLADESSDIQVGIYQLSVHSPKTEPKWVGLEIIDILQASFVKGLQLTFNGQMVRIKTSSLATMMQSETHFIYHLSIEFSVIN